MVQPLSADVMSTDANLGTVLSVDTPDFFRVGDNVEICLCPVVDAGNDCKSRPGRH